LSTDFDGTLVDHQADPAVPPGLVEWITRFRAAGGVWAINTGRELPYLMHGIRQAGLRIVPDYAIVVEREIHRYDNGQYEPVFPWHRLCTEHHAEVFERYRDRWPVLVEWIHLHARATVYQDKYSPFSVIADDQEQATLIHRHMEKQAGGMDGVIYVHNSIYGRFAHKDYHKGSALAELSRILGIDRERVVVAGDHWNDMSMFDDAVAKWWIAPSSAIDAVRDRVGKQASGHVAGRPCGEGLLEGLSRFFPEGFS
jgi:hypothetical protein